MLLRRLGWGYVLIMALWLLLRLLLFDRLWWLALLNTLAFYLFVPLVCLIPAVIWLRQSRLLLGLALPLLVLLIAPGLAPVQPAGARLRTADADTPPQGKYLFVELWTKVDGEGILPALCIDFPNYRFDPATGRLKPYFRPIPPLYPSDWGFAGRGQSRTRAAGCGIGSGLQVIAGLPYTTTIGIGTGAANDSGEGQRFAAVTLHAVSAGGTLSTTIDGEFVALAPGQQWSKLVEADLITDEYNGHYWITSSVTNYGWQSRSLIEGPTQFVWAPLVYR
jgi:hypothetical protein